MRTYFLIVNGPPPLMVTKEKIKYLSSPKEAPGTAKAQTQGLPLCFKLLSGMYISHLTNTMQTFQCSKFFLRFICGYDRLKISI